MNKKIYFIGIAGAGMSPLAAFSKEKGNRVAGSDRFLKTNRNLPVLNQLSDMGITLVEQDGKWISDNSPDIVVYSTAIEEDNPDITAAHKKNIKTLHRAEYLAEIFNQKRGIAVSGTSGKTTITGMLGYLFKRHGLKPDIFCGDRIIGLESSFLEGRGAAGDGECFIAEVDESDGTIVNFKPETGIISNVSRDHKEISELKPLFLTFVKNCKNKCIMDEKTAEFLGISLPDNKIFTAGLTGENDFHPEKICYDPDGVSFIINDKKFHINQPGEYNLKNALYALAVCELEGLPPGKSAEFLREFQGIKRRFELTGEKNGVRVYDDYAHNPDKISAVLKMTEIFKKKRIIIFQPHGYGPLKFMFDGFVECFSRGLKNGDILILLPVYDAGGTADRSISGIDLKNALIKESINVKYMEKGKEECIKSLPGLVHPGDIIIIMGARDPELETFAGEIAGHNM